MAGRQGIRLHHAGSDFFFATILSMITRKAFLTNLEEFDNLSEPVFPESQPQPPQSRNRRHTPKLNEG